MHRYIEHTHNTHAHAPQDLGLAVVIWFIIIIYPQKGDLGSYYLSLRITQARRPIGFDVDDNETTQKNSGWHWNYEVRGGVCHKSPNVITNDHTL